MTNYTAAIAAALALALVSPARSHDIYTGLYGKNAQLCCGGGPNGDCSTTTYRERGAGFEFLTRENDWVAIPQERITFLPIPGDVPPGDSHYSHLCYRAANETDRINRPQDVFGGIFLYCAFIPPGSI